MNREYYSIKDIILGLRGGYLELESDLRELRQCCCTIDKKVDDFSFYLKTTFRNRHIVRRGDDDNFIYFCDNNDNVTLNDVGVVCEFEHNISVIRRIILYIQKKFGMECNFSRYADCLQDDNGNYYMDNENFKAFVRNNVEFCKYIDKILESDFAKRMKFGGIFFGKNSDYMNYALYVYESWFQFRFATDNGRNVGRCIYNMKNDLISFIFRGDKDIVLEDMIMRGFNFNVPSEVLCEYQRELINNNPIIYKDLEIITNSDVVSRIDLSIEEDENKVILRRVKSKGIRR